MRNPLDDTLALAAMPGLEVMAEAIEEVVPQSNKQRRDTRSLLVLAGAARTFGSENKAVSAFTHGGLWQAAVASAERVGRILPPKPPTADQARQLLNAKAPEMVAALEGALNHTAVALARQMGLLTTGHELDLDAPSRAHHVTADGSVSQPLSTITDDDRSRSRAADPATGARVCEAYWGKPPTDDDSEDGRKAGLPFVMVSTHGGLRYQRVVLGLSTYTDGNEIGASMATLDRVLTTAGDGVQTVHYDRLMNDRHILQLMQDHGVVPIVEMAAAAANHRRGVVTPTDDEDYRRGRNRLRAPKNRLRAHVYGNLNHPDRDGRPCWHGVGVLDGELRMTSFNRDGVELDDLPLDLLALERRPGPDRYQMLATYRVPCPRAAGPFKITVDLARPVNDTAGKDALAKITGGRTRPINEHHPAFWDIAGRRSDSESVMATVKDSLPKRRASRLRISDFYYDLIGAALLINATAWDVHVAQHTGAGRHEHHLQQQSQLRAAA